MWAVTPLIPWWVDTRGKVRSHVTWLMALRMDPGFAQYPNMCLKRSPPAPSSRHCTVHTEEWMMTPSGLLAFLKGAQFFEWLCFQFSSSNKSRWVWLLWSQLSAPTNLFFSWVQVLYTSSETQWGPETCVLKVGDGIASDQSDCGSEHPLPHTKVSTKPRSYWCGVS